MWHTHTCMPTTWHKAYMQQKLWNKTQRLLNGLWRIAANAENYSKLQLRMRKYANTYKSLSISIYVCELENVIICGEICDMQVIAEYMWHMPLSQMSAYNWCVWKRRQRLVSGAQRLISRHQSRCHHSWSLHDELTTSWHRRQTGEELVPALSLRHQSQPASTPALYTAWPQPSYHYITLHYITLWIFNVA